MEEESSFSKFLKNLGQIIAIVMILMYALIIVNNYYTLDFLKNDTVATVMNYIQVYAPMSLMITVGLSAVWKKSTVIKIAFLVVCAAIVIFTFDFGIRGDIENFLGF